MRFSISERLKPYCHLPGISLILPGSGHEIQVFPCLVRVYASHRAIPVPLVEIHLDIQGPIQQFTVCNDLERGRVSVWGRLETGWLSYHLISGQSSEGLCLSIERTPLQGIHVSLGDRSSILHKGENLQVLGDSTLFHPYHPPFVDRLSLGNYKAQDWEFIRRRSDLKEWLPLWHRLGQLVPSYELPSINEGTLALLDICRQKIADQQPQVTEQAWLRLIQAAFRAFLVPSLIDTFHQGFIEVKPLHALDISPLVLLTEGARLIRQLFIRQTEGQISILPHLLPHLPCGHLLHVPLDGGGEISLEWTKKVIRRLMLRSTIDREIKFNFRHVRNYRLRQRMQERGERKSCSSHLSLKKDCDYYFDNFQ